MERTMVVGIAVLIVYLILLAIAVASYVMTSLSLYTLAKRRGVRAPGLAWVPIANYWLVGSLANEIDARNGVQRKWNATLLTLSLVAIIGIIIAYIAIIVAGVVYTFSYAELYIDPPIELVLAMILPFYVLLILAMIVAVALSVCTAICIYKIFESTVPEKAVKYLLLYLMVPLAGGICLLKAKDCGYPYPDAPEIFEPITEE